MKVASWLRRGTMLAALGAAVGRTPIASAAPLGPGTEPVMVVALEAGLTNDLAAPGVRVGAFLENPLTRDGYAYVVESAEREPSNPIVRLWLEFYGLEVPEAS